MGAKLSTKAVTLDLPQSGQEAYSVALETGEAAGAVTLTVPAGVATRSGKFIHLNVQAERDGAWYGVPGAGYRCADGYALSHVVKLPAGTRAVRIQAYADVEASTKKIEGKATLTLA